MSPILHSIFQLRSNILVLLLCAVIFLLVDETTAQLEIPSTWRNPTVDISKQLSIDIAAAALDRADDEIVPDDYSLYYTMILAEFDIATNRTPRYKDKVVNYFNFNRNRKVSYSTVHYGALDPVFGYVAALAHIAYNESMFLNIATQTWDSNNNNILSSTGVPPAFENDTKLRDALDTRRQCPDSADLTGGLMTSAKVEMTTSENLLSVLLAEITRNETYLNAAQQYANLLLSHLYTDDSLFWWRIAVNMTDPCQTVINKRKESWNTGFALEALAILSSIRHNETISERHVAVTASLFNSSRYEPWHESTDKGVLKQTEAINIVRGFATVRARKESHSADIAGYVGGYLAVQYNAVLDKATTEGTNVYGNSWIGPPNSTYSVDSQLAAARVLIAGIGLASQLEIPSSSTSPPLTSPSEPSSPEAKSSNVGAIVGGVLGGLFFIALIVVGSLFIIRRRSQHMVSQSTEVMQAFPGSVASTPPAGKPRQSEKRRQLEGRRHIVSPSTHPRSEEPQASTDLPSGSSRSSRSEPSTVELVQMLNQRLQGERWDREEPPPGYSN
ncbi:hypothetical protein VNI00_004708 [Paramarasmius palmivorus]|uniref:Glycoside hydrolase family 76 protein n=1 Tax=Paramarasmius palmivorus TaxID=297713 RepID=A0AAW0DHC8_9AGAR